MRRVTIGLLTLCLCMQLWAATVQILATGDMHGWLEPAVVDGQRQGGPAAMLAYWKSTERYTPKKFLVVSCGDVATGPALSTVFKGESTIAMMNLLGYDVSALGNHEFDFGEAGLKNMTQWARFPILAGNLLNADGTPNALVAGTCLYTEQGVKVGIIGLTIKELSSYANIGTLKTTSYAEAIRKLAPALRTQGAQVLIVISHAELATLEKLANEVADLRIPLMLGGHTHECAQRKVGNTWVMNNGEWWKGYGRIDLEVNERTGTAAVRAITQVWLQNDVKAVKNDPAALKLIRDWTNKLPKEMTEPIGYTTAGLTRRQIANLVTDSWLAAYPADIAICNLGGLRQDLPPGNVRRLDLLGVMPFDNAIYRLELTGKQLTDYKTGETLMLGGARRTGGSILLANSQPLEPGRVYTVLINDFLYNTSAHLKDADPTPEKVDAGWRNPVATWLAAHPTDAKTPLEGVIDLKPRIE
jgi:5'-nucleotidase/UDP-sugar diphosphatase